VDWRERYERAAARYAAGETRELDERQLVQLANAAWAAGLSLLMAGDPEGAAEWLRRSAERYRESWQPGSESWGRPIGALKALLIADDCSPSGRVQPSNSLLQAARWTLDAGAAEAEAESPIGRYAGVFALLTLGRDEEAGALAETLGEEFPGDVVHALRALASDDASEFRTGAAAIRRRFARREDFLEDVPVPDTALALEALARSRGLL
jgi:hypothetical protein